MEYLNGEYIARDDILRVESYLIGLCKGAEMLFTCERVRTDSDASLFSYFDSGSGCFVITMDYSIDGKEYSEHKLTIEWINFKYGGFNAIGSQFKCWINKILYDGKMY